MQTTARRVRPRQFARKLSSSWPDTAAAVAGSAALLAAVTVPLEATQQAVVAVLSFAVFLGANRVGGRPTSVFLALLSAATSLRYLVWRVFETLDFGNPFELAFGAVLVGAEVYAVAVLVFGYVQTLWPLGRSVCT